MTKRVVGWTIALALCVAGGLGALKALRLVRRGLRHTSIAEASAAPNTPDLSQSVAPKPVDFLKPERPDAWEIIGPGGGGTFHNPSISPHDHNLVFASTDMSACYASENGGRTWRSFNLRATCTFVFDPKLPNRIYAMAGGGTWRSEDRGHTWSLVFPEYTTEVHYIDDEAGPMLFSTQGYIRPYIASMQVDPDDSNILYASLDEQLVVSNNLGKDWKVLAKEAFAQQLWIDPTSPRNNRIIYLRRGNAISTWDGKQLIKRVIPGGPEVYGKAAFGTPTGGGKPVIYIGSDYQIKDGQAVGGGVMASDDGGQTWRSLNDGILKMVAKGTFPNFSTIATSRNHAEVIYASVTHFTPAGLDYAEFGLIKSTDGGKTWAVSHVEAGQIPPNMHNDWTSLRFGADWADEPLFMGVDDNDADLIYTGDLGRMMRSANGGKTWEGVFSQSTGTGYTTTGLDDTTCYGIHFDPFDPKHVFITYTDIGLWRSEDGGQSWLSASSNGVPRAWQSNSYWVEFDPAVRGKLWAVMTNHHDLPRLREVNRNGVGGVVMSLDGGHTWTIAGKTLAPSTVPTHIILDPKSPVDARVLYLTAFGAGIYKSTNGGENWALKNNGLPKERPRVWRTALASDGTLYTVTIRRSEDLNFGNENDGCLYRSRDGAETWEKVPLPDGLNGPQGITVDPRDPKRLYLSAWARHAQYDGGHVPLDGGIFISDDGGQHWRNVMNYSRRVYDVTVDPNNSDVVYAAGFESAAWRSTDRGKTWNRIGGFNFGGGHRVFMDPVDASKIYITTMGNSVWHGPAAGDPKAVEDIVSPPTMRFQGPRWK